MALRGAWSSLQHPRQVSAYTFTLTNAPDDGTSGRAREVTVEGRGLGAPRDQEA